MKAVDCCRVLVALSMLAWGGCARELAHGRPWVHSLTLIGVKQVKEGDLTAKLGITATSRNPLADKSYLSPFGMSEETKRIEAFYRARGYYAGRVTASEVVMRPGGKSVDVHISIDEGLPTRIAALHMGGTEDLVVPRLRKALAQLTMKAGQIFDSDKFREEQELIAGALKANGYPWAKVEGSAAVDRDTRLASVDFVVERGPLCTIEGLVVRGTATVDPLLVAAETRVAAGASFRLHRVEDARIRIYHLGVFSSVKMSYEPVEERPDQVRIVATVKEATFNELRLGGGFGIDAAHNEVHLEGVYTRHNFLGGLRTLALRLQPAYVVVPAVWDVHRHGPGLIAEATLTQPRLGFLSQVQWTVGYDVGVEYAYQYQGPRTSLGALRLLWRDRVSLSLSYNFQLLTFFNTDPAILNDPAQAGRFFGFANPYRVGWWQQDASLDLRDRPLDTRKGAFFLVSAEEGGDYAGGAFQYEKVRGEARGYLPLGSRVVVAVRAQFGHLFSQGELGSPITRRFYLGGPNSHRGFNYGRLSLQVPSGVPGSAPLPVGGDEMFLAQAEVRIKLASVRGSWLYFAAFFDTGDVAAPSCGTAVCALMELGAKTHVDFSRLHHTVGGGFRLKTVIGTLRADLGARLNRLAPTESDGLPNPDPGERFAFHLSVAESF